MLDIKYSVFFSGINVTSSGLSSQGSVNSNIIAFYRVFKIYLHTDFSVLDDQSKVTRVLL